MQIINDIDFKKTDDGSVGLFSKRANDIFHSKFGAQTEANEKFIFPLVELLNINNKETFNVLDICYGIGYNTKSLLNEYYNKIFYIDALEYNEELVLLSSIIYDNIENINLRNFLLNEIISSDLDLNNLYEFINSKEFINNKMYFSDFYVQIIEFYQYLHSKNIILGDNNSFLHNIYYNYISLNNIDCLKNNKYKESTIKYVIGDARKTIKTLNKSYDIVFLDAFSPQKDPTLWTYDFLLEVSKRMNNNSVLVSYSKSTPFRSALLELGFYVGKTIINDVDMGTIASFNKNFIKNTLSNFDFELIKTRCGICYKDPALNLSSNEILKNRETESKLSNRISHTQFLKLNKK